MSNLSLLPGSPERLLNGCIYVQLTSRPQPAVPPGPLYSSSLIDSTMSNIFLVFRYLAFALFITFNSVICIMAALNLGSLIPHTQKFPEVDSYVIFTGAIGLVFVFPVIFVELIRKNAFIARVFVEIIWVGLLWVMNLSAAAATTAISSQIVCLPKGKQLAISCTSTKLLLAFTWLNTITLLSYFMGLVICAVYHSHEDGSVWYSGVRDYRWFAPSKSHQDLSDSFSYGKMVEPKEVSTVPPIYARQMGLTKGYTVEPLRIETNLAASRPAHWVEFATPAGPVTSAEPLNFPQRTEFNHNISQGPSAPAPVHSSHSHSSHSHSLYPKHLQSTVVPQVLPTRTGGSTPPPAGSWPRSNPQEPIRRSKPRTNTGDSFTPSLGLPQAPAPATKAPEMAPQVPPEMARPRPSGPRTLSTQRPRPRPPPLDLSRLILLFVDNFLALTAAAWSVSSGHENHIRASPGAVLVILSSISYGLLFVGTWAEACIPGTRLSRIRTEAALIPMLATFQIIAAAIVTSNVAKSVCRDSTSCVALLIFSWMAAFTLVIYYLVVLAVTLQHGSVDINIWDASPLQYPWFSNSPIPPPKEGVDSRRFKSPFPSTHTESSTAERRRKRSSWIPVSLHSPFHLPSFPRRIHSSNGSRKSFGMPAWAKEIGPIRRGLELPFPVTTSPTQAVPPMRFINAPRLDAPVSPIYYGEGSSNGGFSIRTAM
ncbi:hypothetical protein BU17DRAFT_87315 [Hysterangium stoloniferum]|nr:hypothetical protein BU17DRAFT_87315 [Hysterangium stoloniferum]